MVHWVGPLFPGRRREDFVRGRRVTGLIWRAPPTNAVLNVNVLQNDRRLGGFLNIGNSLLLPPSNAVLNFEVLWHGGGQETGLRSTGDGTESSGEHLLVF